MLSNVQTLSQISRISEILGEQEVELRTLARAVPSVFARLFDVASKCTPSSLSLRLVGFVDDAVLRIKSGSLALGVNSDVE